MTGKFYITTPIYYINDRPHAGNAYTTVSADTFSRYHRQKKERVFFLTGTDEHGIKIEKAAKEAGQEPKIFCDEKAQTFKKAWKILNIDYDNFIRTTEPLHISAVSRVLEILFKKGFIYKGEYQGYYCEGCEQFKSEKDLINGKCPDHQKELVLLKEECYLLKLSHFEKVLIKKISEGELIILPEERKNEILNFLKNGLKDIAISRKTVRWGIPLPFDKSFTTYVWVDAFLNYLTGLGWQGEPKELPEFWPPDVQLMAKDILRVHSTIWPALLLALEIPLPKRFLVHGFFTADGRKMSKSLGNVIWPEDLVKKFGPDGTRYLLISFVTYGADGDLSWDKLKEKYNADLANGIGNLFERVLTLVKNYDFKTKKSKIDSEISNWQEKTDKIYSEKMDNYQLYEAVNAVFAFSKKIDQYINQKEPWQLLKTKDAELDEVLTTLISGLKNIIGWLKPFMPEKMEQAEKYLKNFGPGSPKLNLFPRL